MKKILAVLVCLCYPLLALADSTLSFAPPSTDYSVIFLGNLFGVVDGVLHGTGSQIMGKMFSVFNAAVLALGGIIVTYTLIVGTMNTSHEGQFLGQKWSSIWIPIRSTVGLALLIPKASGYCLMQIFVMWVVVQGVGAADKIWNAALDYLNLGGVIVAAQSNVNSTTGSDDVAKIAKGESAILQGQVCMYGIQTILENARADYLEAKDAGSGPCLDGKMDSTMSYFCSTTIPDFLSTVNAVEVSNLGKTSVDMPHFTDGSVYEQLNGICGTIAWNPLDMAKSTNNLDYVSADDVSTLNQSRPIGIQQMYMDLLPVSMAMVNNDPAIKINTSSDASSRYSSIAQDQYGVPYLSSTQSPCTTPSTDCMLWNPASGGNTQTYIFTGLEFINTMTDYNAIMMPVLNLMSQNSNADTSNQYHEFIQGAEDNGWIMAGSYFFDLANLNGSVTSTTNEVDTTSGLDGSSFYDPNALLAPFSNGCTGDRAALCTMLNKNSAAVVDVNNLITGQTVQEGMTANVDSGSGHVAIQGLGSASTYGYITNASMINLPGQPGLSTPEFSLAFNMKPGQLPVSIPHKNFGCGFRLLSFCVGGPIANVLWNMMIKYIVEYFIQFITNLFDLVVQQLLYLPLSVMMTVLNNGVQLLNTTQTHPIVALAYMGTTFINYVTSLYFQLIAMSAIFSLGGTVILLVVLPFLAAWMGVMFTIGFLNAYYVPFLPYMIFTFGSLAWLMAVIEAMVAGPIVALGVTHPEGHDALGKAEAALMILINVFLRPSMMIIGYIAGIALSYVAIFIINSGFSHVMEFFMPPQPESQNGSAMVGGSEEITNVANTLSSTWQSTPAGTPYTNYAAMYAGFFCLLVYTTLYWTVVEKSFTLIYLLPDNILRWIGGQPEQYGKETAQWSEATKAKVEKGGEETAKAAKETSEGLGQKAGEAVGLLKGGKGKGKVD